MYTTLIVAHRWGGRGRGWCRRASRIAFINGHLADQRLAIRQMHRLWVPPTVAPEAGDRSLSHWFRTRPTSLQAALFLIASGAAFTLSRSYAAGTRQAFALS